MQAGAVPWRTVNRWLYRVAHRLLAAHRPAVRRWRRRLRASSATLSNGARGDSTCSDRAHSTRSDRERAPIVCLAGGRLGDALLAAAWTRHYRGWFRRPIVVVGRPETAAVVAPLVDTFVPLGHGDDETAVAAALGGPIAGVIGDLHLFHGNRALQGLLAALQAPVKVVYDGWIDRELQAPWRRWPAGTRVVAGVYKPPGTDAERRHVLLDLAHYHRHVLDVFGIDAPLPERPWLSPTLRDPGAIAPFGLAPEYIACHARSSQGKKDWPLAAWRQLFAAFPRQSFVLLGAAGERGELAADNARDLRGRTTVAQALAIAAQATAFVGVDSGLAHAAALASVPTVVPMPQATPGYFFPYPRSAGALVETVVAAEYAACAGCGGICAHEPLWRSRRLGLPCVRGLRVDAVAAALARALAPPATAPEVLTARTANAPIA
jgi:hypothetical protein